MGFTKPREVVSTPSMPSVTSTARGSLWGLTEFDLSQEIFQERGPCFRKLFVLYGKITFSLPGCLREWTGRGVGRSVVQRTLTPDGLPLGSRTSHFSFRHLRFLSCETGLILSQRESLSQQEILCVGELSTLKLLLKTEKHTLM